MEYLIRIRPESREQIGKTLNVLWESKLLRGLMAVESDLSIEEIHRMAGVVKCQENGAGSFEV